MPVEVMLATAAFALLLFVLGGGPIFLVDWSRKRRQQEIARQIALTDAIDGRVGVTVAPVVRKPLLRPWEVQIALPIHQSALAAKILTVVDEAFVDVERAHPRPYRVFLTAQLDSPPETNESWSPSSAAGWVKHPVGAA